MKISKKSKFWKDCLEVEDCENGKVVLNVGYLAPIGDFGEESTTACGIYLTKKEAAKLRDWLTQWLKEQAK